MCDRAKQRVGFTLIEILVAVAVLVVVVLVCGQVFQAASAVTRTSNASGVVLQEAWGIEQQIRADLARISPDGALVIHSVEVPNDYNQRKWDQTGIRPPLINPGLPKEAVVRCDQLLFFMDGFQPTKPYGSTDVMEGGEPRIIGGGAAVTYGHGLQFSELSGYSIDTPSDDEVEQSLYGDLPMQFRGHDIDLDDHRDSYNLARVAPFHRSNVLGQWGGQMDAVYSKYGFHGGGLSDLYNQTEPAGGASDIRGDQPEARRWILTRQAMAMADDDSYPPNASNKQIYLTNAFSIESLFPADPRRVDGSQAGFTRESPVHDMGRVDVMAMNLGDVRKSLLHTRDESYPDNMERRSWFADDAIDGTHGVLEDNTALPGGSGDPERGTQRYLLKTLLGWPRVERTPPGPARYDQALTNSILGSACSSFIVEWTWDDNVGETTTWQVMDPTNPSSRRNRVTWQGYRYDPGAADPSDLPSAGTVIEFDALGNSRTRLRQKGDLFWFGLPDKRDNTEADDQWDRGVVSFAQFATAYPARTTTWDTPSGVLPEAMKWPIAAPSLVHPDAIDKEASGFPGEPREYWALFGPNRRWPLMRTLDASSGPADPDEQESTADGLLDPDPSYTPWPSALRFSMVLHDPETNLEHGKLVQFIVELPKERLQ
ncbi:MAG: hypothetical protein QF471_08385 [Phycisphaerales bacterium]|nr:hypothetical protein [Phycisphaerales bacterium]